MARRVPGLQRAGEERVCHQSDGRTTEKGGHWVHEHLLEPSQGIRQEGKEDGGERGGGGAGKMSGIDVHLHCHLQPHRLHHMELHP